MRAIKKIAALAVGATMLGATLMGAMAADLADYPSMCIEDTTCTCNLVVGDAAAAEDVVGAIDVRGGLSTVETDEVEEEETITLEGDAWKVGTSTKDLELTENPATLQHEEISDIATYIGEDELTALADGEISNEKGTAKYSQYLYFDNTATEYVQYNENDDDLTAIHFFVEGDDQIARYSMEFTTDFKTDIKTLSLEDYENEKIVFLGKEFTIVDAKTTDASVWAEVEMTLMSGPIQDTLNQGETKTYTLNGKDYEVKVTYIGTTNAVTSVAFTINEETTDKMVEGDTYKLEDGTEIGVRNLYEEEAGEITPDQVEFYLGATKMVIKDNNITDAVSSDTLEVGGEDIDDAAIIITGTTDGVAAGDIAIDQIQVNITADDDYFVGKDEKLSDMMDEPEALFTGNWDIEFKGLITAETEDIKITTSGDDKYNLYFTDADGETVKLPLAYTAGAGQLAMGDDKHLTVLKGGDTIKKKDYFILWDKSLANEENTWALQYLGADASGDTTPKIKFKNLGSGATIERSVKAAAEVAQIKLGGQTFRVYNASDHTKDHFNITIDQDGAGAGMVEITTHYGASIVFAGEATDATLNWTGLTIDTADTDDYNDKDPTAITVNITENAGTAVEVDMAYGGLTGITPEDEENVVYGYTSYGTHMKFTSPSGSPNEMYITYPKKQLLPQLFVTSGATTTTVGGGTTKVIKQVTVPSAMLASEALLADPDMNAKNYLLVGGPCANPGAAKAMGIASTVPECLEGFEEGKAMIKAYDTGAGKFAIVVAGMTAADTRRATEVLANYADYALSGDEIEVTGTSLADISVKTVTAAAEE